MKYILSISAILILSMAVSSCNNSSDTEIKAGVWRATLKTQSGAEVPFNFEVIDSANQKFIDLINGKERFRLNEITLNRDSVLIQMPFDSEIRAKKQGKYLTGQWIKHLADKDVSMQFDAEPDASWRFFKVHVRSESNVSGRWSATFSTVDNKDTTFAVGEFNQDDRHLFGTFLTNTGDYRFLQGTISDKKLYLSSFDGGNAYLFTGKLTNDSTIVDGKLYSGYSSIKNWAAKKDEKAILPDAYSITGLKRGYNKINFAFPGLDGKIVSLSDKKFTDKVVIVQFLGSWCPNCMDETAYLVPLYNKYKERGLEIIGLAYERTKDFERSKKNVERMKKRLAIPYDILLTGYTNNTNEVSKSFPMLENFMAFPTMLVIDKRGIVGKIHTGFSGPGTGRHYDEFVKEFENTIVELLEEE